MIRELLRALRCRLGWCGGRIVSGTHGGEIWIGWRCAECGRVKGYEPSCKLFDERAGYSWADPTPDPPRSALHGLNR